MSHKMTVDVPDHVYEPLKKTALGEHRNPEEVASEWLATVAACIPHHGVRPTALDASLPTGGDALLSLAGIFVASVPRVAERHDDYIGEGILRHVRDDGDD